MGRPGKIVNPQADERRTRRANRATASALRGIRKGPRCETHKGVKLIQDAVSEAYLCPICDLGGDESEGQGERDREYRRATGGRKRRLPPKSVN